MKANILIVEDEAPLRNAVTDILTFEGFTVFQAKNGQEGLDTALKEHPDLLERVVECQSPVFLLVEVQDSVVTIHFTVPREAPTTRGFASILHSLLNGKSVEEVLGASDSIPDSLSLSDAVSPLRLRGMRGMLHRIKRQVEQKS